MNTRLLIPLIIAGALAFACGPRSRSEGPSAAFAAAQSTRVAAKSSSTVRRRAAASDVKLDSHLKIDVAPQAVRFALGITNVGHKHAELDFPSGQSYDFVVLDSIGREVWHWSNGHMFTQSVQNKQLGAGDTMEVSETWSKAPAGHYTAVATINSSNYPVEERAEFTLR